MHEAVFEVRGSGLEFIHHSLIYVPAIMVTGGGNDGAEKSVELLHSDGTPWCSLPDLPADRFQHSQTGLEACGGVDTVSGPVDTCIKFSGGKWKHSHKLKKNREGHSGWASPAGTVLMGGTESGKRTELLDATTGVSVMHFPLKYDTE